MPAPSGERATLSRDLADFLIELSIALHKHAMYPEGHPSLAPAAAAVTRRAGLLLEERSSVSLGVARHQLVIEGVATDPKHPVLRELASRLHRHHLGAVTFRRGLAESEVADVLKAVAVDAERTGQPMGLGDSDKLRAWSHVQLHPLTYERLELVGEGAPAEGARAAQLWVGLARAALATEASDERSPPTEPAVIAQAIDARPRGGGGAEAYDQVIVGYLLQIAQELKSAGGAEAVALRRRISRLIRSLRPETLRRLVEMGGDFAQRRQFVADAAAGMAADAVLEILKAAAETSQQAISHSLVRLLSKLAAHAESGSDEIRPQAEAALREQVQRLLQGWTLADPNPGVYGAALQRMARAAPTGPAAPGESPAEPERVVAMALEVETVGPRAVAAVEHIVEAGRLGALLEALQQVPDERGAARAVWERVATSDVVRRLVRADPPDFTVLDRLIPHVGYAAAEPLLDALAVAQSRGARRGLLAQLVRLGAGIGPLVVRRLEDDRWYVIRNLLALLEDLAVLPEGFSPARFALHADARVRRQAVKLQLKLPDERDVALVTALKDQDPRTVRLALGLIVALHSCPAAAVSLLVSRASDRVIAADLRVLAIRALGATTAPAALEALLRLTTAGRTLFGKERLPPKSPELLVALAALVTGWAHDPRTRAVLARAAQSTDREIRAAAARPVPPLSPTDRR
ncbi:MAG: hypothetical protein AUG79_12225 [Gemmatimonadetes bacterium 13_1_20CM_4_69_16]|nr:MAG: hypothetical protein AUG79_12225 [Gemmatimonadetes bacterium 13_1_20CM_4_69_16]